MKTHSAIWILQRGLLAAQVPPDPTASLRGNRTRAGTKQGQGRAGFAHHVRAAASQVFHHGGEGQGNE